MLVETRLCLKTMRWPNFEVILKTLLVVPGQTGVPTSKLYRPSEVMQRGVWLPEIGASPGPRGAKFDAIAAGDRDRTSSESASVVVDFPYQLPRAQLESPVKMGYLPRISLRARSSHFAWWDRRADSRVLAIKGFSDKRLLDRKIESNRVGERPRNTELETYGGSGI